MRQPPTACKTCQHAPCECRKTSVAQAFRFAKKVAEVDKALDCARWRDFNKTFSAYNITCQHISAEGIRCTQPGVIVHHIVGRHSNPSLMYSPANCVRVCREHHPNTDGDSADANYSWAPTRWRSGFEPVVEIPHAPTVKATLASGEVQITSDGRAIIG